MFLRGVFGEKEPGRFHDYVGTHLAPFQLGRVFDSGQADALAVHDEGAALDRDVAFEAAVYRVVLEHIGPVVGLEQVVDGNDLDVGKVLYGGAQHHAADAPETIDANFDAHVFLRKMWSVGLRSGNC